MVKNLLILRHATSASQGTDGQDFTRPLTSKGVQEASIQGRFLKEAGILPSHIGSSSADRARQTTETLAESLGASLEPRYHDELYNAPGMEILEQVRRIPDDHDTALVVAHIPGVAELLDILTTDFHEVAVAFTPATMAGVSFKDLSRWADIEPGTGILEWLLPPFLLQE
ncbi:MAG: histidine phosphatase family protein [bacterium]